jgi:uncharacterized protein YdcH (DUF465 family)
MKTKISLWMSFCVLFIISCADQPSEQWVQEGARLQKQLIEAHCAMEQLNGESKQLWDTVVYAMDEQLPATMPTDERRNMLKVRNASLIRMFEVYPRLPDAVQHQVDEAERKDQELAARMKAQVDTIKYYENRIDDFIKRVAVSHPDSARIWQLRFSVRDCK